MQVNNTDDVTGINPVHIGFKLDKIKYSKDDDIELKLHFNFYDKKSSLARIVIETNEIIKIKDRKKYIDLNLNYLADKEITVRLSKPFNTNGYGKIRAHIYTYDERGNKLYYNMTRLCCYISEEGIFFPKNERY